MSERASSSTQWVFCDSVVPKSQITYICQIAIIVIVVCAAIVNISLDKNIVFWGTVLANALGSALPCPSVKITKTPSQFSV
jgi:hypothetical protein